ncbi:hypothetical protein HG537_0D06230 [Torulaspora globosa]|uniref:Impact N-terminal domain-containing protein n=1 Tax=Torulaspora globosa TaxID=48254 RepID=A0A7H9HW64_9SACH|nr:hypothetical protein HG537_0D06230 [Torulaspora sp. CBS 2947]
MASKPSVETMRRYITNCNYRLRRYSSLGMQVWNESEVLVDRKSKFQARSCAIKDQADIPSLLQILLQDKRIARASHPHMYAWRTGELKSRPAKDIKVPKTDKRAGTGTAKVFNVHQGSSDGGESGAGQRLLTLLEQANVVNVLVVVTRWYGGTPLGPARFRHISSTAVESLKKGGFLP